MLQIKNILYSFEGMEIGNRFYHRSELAKERSKREFAALSNSTFDPNMTEDELKKLAYEYDDHVRLCVAHYGDWSTAIKSVDSMHMPDYRGNFLNVERGLRVTTGAIKTRKHYIYIFGGSTIFCGEVKDSLTICSQLQAKIKNFLSTISVVNFGRHGSTFRNRVIYLEKCKLEKDDLVIFWFGANELGWKLLEGKTDVPFWIFLFRRASEGLRFFSKHLALLEMLSKIFDEMVLQPLYQIYAYFDAKDSLIKLDELSKSLGFKYEVFLQPCLLTKQIRTQREDVMLNFFMSRDKGKIIKNLFDANYPRFRGLLSRFNGVDGTDIFAHMHQEVFVDWCHLNSVGNQIAAEFIFDSLKANGLFDRF